MNRPSTTPILVLFITLTAALTGCNAATRLTRPLAQAGNALFTSATLADLELVGVKTGPLLPIQAGPFDNLYLLGEEIPRNITDHLGQTPLGVLLPITRVGETTPWWIFCPAGDFQKRCEEIPANARVTFTGRPLGHGTVLLPTRLTWTAR